ncbi:glutamate receptor 1 [Eurytemora carolleeae]|uniref:glutamate receptor 1 n=1 Tax=Eurytemora carolleeae TaxID=1294199 RepID=UPI000C759E07|nr:glutamate receptor 1 [Eurytemora carolleeae]|eukprot:XP_023345277.1 glutamate receptor 1-like [Eurytemora affinis]
MKINLDVPYVAIQSNGQSFLYRNQHGEIFPGVWSSKYSKLMYKGLKGVHDNTAVLQSNKGHFIRIAYNNYKPRFYFENNKCDQGTFEGLYLCTYIESRNLSNEFIDSDYLWGSYDNNTGTWNGVVGKVGYGNADIGVTFISYTYERIQFVAYTLPVGLDVSNWISMYPGKVSPATNIVKVFDTKGWIAIGICTLAIGFALLLVRFVGQDIEFKQPDAVLVMLMPLAVLNAEQMPDWFILKTTRVISGSILLMFWSLASTLLTLAFSSNLRAIILTPTYATPIDTAQQIVQANKLAVLEDSTWQLEFLQSSPNPWQQQVLKRYRNRDVEKQSWEDLIMSLVYNPNDVIIEAEDNVLYFVQQNPDLANLSRPPFYFSKELLRPYHSGWVIQKESKWEDDINMHILYCHQAGFDVSIFNKFGKDRSVGKNPVSDQEKLGIEHLLVAFFILGSGFILALSGFSVEVIVSKKRKYDV